MSDESDEPVEAEAGAESDETAKPAKKAKAPKPPKAPKAKSGKKKGIPWVLVLIPVAVVAALVLAFTLPPTRAMLAKTPLGPLLARFSHEAAKNVAAGPQKTSDPAADVRRLNAALAGDKQAAAQKDAQIAQLQAQVTQLQATAAPTTTPAAKPTPSGVSDDVKRAAAYWAGMDADKAADIIKQLPDEYVKAVFSQMPPDAVADIMSALPAKTAARLTTDNPPVAR